MPWWSHAEGSIGIWQYVHALPFIWSDYLQNKYTEANSMEFI